MKTVKQSLGWIMFVLVTPFVLGGILAYIIADAVVAGWNISKKMIDEWDD